MEYFFKVIKLTGDIAKDKNRALKEALTTDKDYFFLIEDNCKVLDNKVYQIFIDTSKKTGIEALMWARGSLNKRLPFGDDPHVDYWSDFVSSFSMFTRNVVEKAGFMDEKMPPNTWQDLEYAKRIGDMGLSSPFGVFAAPKDVDEYFSITKPKDEFKNLKQLDEALVYWEQKAGDEFPINIVKEKEKLQENAPITEMI
jgi:hypothetical protein